MSVAETLGSAACFKNARIIKSGHTCIYHRKCTHIYTLITAVDFIYAAVYALKQLTCLVTGLMVFDESWWQGSVT